MKYYHLGQEDAPVLLLLPSTCCHWRANFGGRLHAAYGCSLGGSFVGLLMQRRNIHMAHGILGSSDLDQDSRWKREFPSRVRR